MNTFLKQRIDALLAHFRAGHFAGDSSASANRGTEREAFLLAFLSQILPPIYRVGTGEITDVDGNRSGQLDIVVEMPWAPSIGFPGSPVRLYPAEAVGVAIEVKSDIKNQWDEVQRTLSQLSTLRQRLSGISSGPGTLEIHDISAERIPTFAVGFVGWRVPDVLEQKVLESELDGLLILDKPIFVASDRLLAYRKQDCIAKDPNLKAHQRLIELKASGKALADIAAILNSEGATSPSSVHLGDHRFLPIVAANEWTPSSVEESWNVLRRRTTVHTETEALLAFLGEIHRELSKRSGMTVNLNTYA